LKQACTSWLMRTRLSTDLVLVKGSADERSHAEV